MRILVTGSSGHLGEALLRALPATGHEGVGLDLVDSPYTEVAGSICDRLLVRSCMEGVDAVVHAATLHKPHLATHSRQEFVQTNVMGTLNVLEAAVDARIVCVVLTSTTSVFGGALVPPPAAPASWITEDVEPVPKNVYGATKAAAEDLCRVVHREHDLPCVVLRTSRFFPEADDDPAIRDSYSDANVKVNELLYRRIDLEDAVTAHLLALEKAPSLGFATFVVSATTPFTPGDLPELRTDAAAVVRRRVPGCEASFAELGWTLFPSIDRVYVNERARRELGWVPRFDFGIALSLARAGLEPRSSLAADVGAKGYHAFTSLPYTAR